MTPEATEALCQAVEAKLAHMQTCVTNYLELLNDLDKSLGCDEMKLARGRVITSACNMCDPNQHLAALLAHARHWQAEAARLADYTKHRVTCNSGLCGKCGMGEHNLYARHGLTHAGHPFEDIGCTCGLLPAARESGR